MRRLFHNSIFGTFLIILVVAAVFIFGLPFLGYACHCYDCSCFKNFSKCRYSHKEIEPGTYYFEKKNINKFVYYEASIGQELKDVYGNVSIDRIHPQNFFEKCYHMSTEYKFPTARSEGILVFDVSPSTKEVDGGCSKKYEEYLVYEDCVITVEVTINGKTQTFDLELNEKGHARGVFRINIDPTYTIKANYKIVDCSGTVYSGPSSTSQLEYGDYILKYHNEGYYEIVGFKNNPETLYIYDSIDVGTGSIPIKNLGSIFTYNSKNKEYPGESLSKTKTIIFEGSFDINDLAGEWLTGETYQGNKVFRNVQNVVINNITGSLTKTLKFTLREGGTTFYINDNSENHAFTNALNNSYFVNGIYSYDDFN